MRLRGRIANRAGSSRRGDIDAGLEGSLKDRADNPNDGVGDWLTALDDGPEVGVARNAGTVEKSGQTGSAASTRQTQGAAPAQTAAQTVHAPEAAFNPFAGSRPRGGSSGAGLLLGSEEPADAGVADLETNQTPVADLHRDPGEPVPVVLDDPVADSGPSVPAATPVSRRDDGPEHDYEARFAEMYVAARKPALELLDDQASAEDVVTDVLARLYFRWKRTDDEGGRFWAVKETTEIALKRATQHGGSGPKASVAELMAEDALADARATGSTPAVRDAPTKVNTIEHKLGESRPRVIAALSKLPAKKRRVVALKYFADMSEDEIAAGLSLPVSVVTLRIEQALDDLSERLGPEVGGLDDLA